MTKTAKGLVEYAKAQLGKPYWYGTFGQAASKDLYNQKKKQYPDYYTWAYAGETVVKVHDCVGLIKGYIWCDSPADNTPVYNSAQDKSADGMYNICTKKGDISTLPEVPGTLVFMKGHVGVYIGGGYVVEARGHNYGVVQTKLSSRPWKNGGYCPYIAYEAQDAPVAEDVKKVEYTIGFSYLRKGAKGAPVKALQQLLIANGYYCGSTGADGSFGSNTEKAVKAYQKAKALDADGVVGPATLGKLLGV